VNDELFDLFMMLEDLGILDVVYRKLTAGGYAIIKDGMIAEVIF